MPRPVASGRAYVAGLDGLRALAVLAVLGYHLGIPQAAGGLLGVGMFFTLSGFLITSILLGSWERTRTFELKRFWLHRARRLLPAVVVMLAAVLCWTWLTDSQALKDRWGETWSALLYVANWHTIAQGDSYFERFLGPGPLDHLWSLSVEEQFYVVWPLLLLLAFSVLHLTRRAVGIITLLLAAGSFGLLAVLAAPGFDNTRAYEGTDTRAGGILVGALLAFCWPTIRTHVERSAVLQQGLQLLGVVGTVGVAWLVTSTDDYSMSLYSYGLLLLSVCTAAMVAAVSLPGGWFGWLLGQEPLRWLGERSYGIYLWQLPLVASVSTTTLADRRWLWGVVMTAATLALAELSWRLVENPIRTHGFLGAMRSARTRLVRVGNGDYVSVRMPVHVVAPVAVIAIGTSTLVACHVADPDGDLQAEMSMQSTDGMPPIPDDVDTVRHHGGGKHGKPSEDPSEDPSEEPTEQPGDVLPAKAQTSCTDVAYIGESTSLGLISPDYLPNPQDRLEAQMRKHGVTDLTTDILGARSIVERWHDEPNAQEGAEAINADGFDGCWVIAMGTNDSANQAVGGVYPYPERIDLLMKQLGDAPVMWLTVKSLNSSGAYADANMAAFDSELEKACKRYPNLRLFDWRSEVQDPWFISDGIHYTSQGYQQRAMRIGNALAQAFPADSEPAATCSVTSGLS